MSDGKIIQENGENIIPITHETCVLDDEGNPITETIGDVSLLNTESRNLVGAVNEVFGDIIKEQIIGALVDKGLDINISDSWDNIIKNINNITTKTSLNVTAGDSVVLYQKTAAKSTDGFSMGPGTVKESICLNIEGSVKFFARWSVTSTANALVVKLLDSTQTTEKFVKEFKLTSTSGFYGANTNIEGIESSDYIIIEYKSPSVTNGVTITNLSITADLV